MLICNKEGGRASKGDGFGSVDYDGERGAAFGGGRASAPLWICNVVFFLLLKLRVGLVRVCLANKNIGLVEFLWFTKPVNRKTLPLLSGSVLGILLILGFLCGRGGVWWKPLKGDHRGIWLFDCLRIDITVVARLCLLLLLFAHIKVSTSGLHE